MSRYYYSDEKGLPTGPVDVGELSRLLATGILNRNSNVAQAGANKWVSIRSILPESAFSADASVPRSSITTSAPAIDFPVLKIISTLYKVVAVIAFLIGVITVFVAVAAPEVTPLGKISIVVWTLLIPLLLWGGGELILVFLSIEQHTRRTTDLLNNTLRHNSRLETATSGNSQSKASRDLS
jgi:hypothetical protein